MHSLYVSTQPIKTCGIFCLSICLLIPGLYAFTWQSLRYYFTTPRLFPVMLILQRGHSDKSGKKSSLSVLMLETCSTFHVRSVPSWPPLVPLSPTHTLQPHSMFPTWESFVFSVSVAMMWDNVEGQWSRQGSIGILILLCFSSLSLLLLEFFLPG